MLGIVLTRLYNTVDDTIMPPVYKSNVMAQADMM